MHLSNNESREGLVENPKGCAKGSLVNEELVKSGNAEVVTYEDRGSSSMRPAFSTNRRIRRGKKWLGLPAQAGNLALLRQGYGG